MPSRPKPPPTSLNWPPIRILPSIEIIATAFTLRSGSVLKSLGKPANWLKAVSMKLVSTVPSGLMRATPMRRVPLYWVKEPPITTRYMGGKLSLM